MTKCLMFFLGGLANQKSSFWLQVVRHTKNEPPGRRWDLYLILDLKVYPFDVAMILTTTTLI